MIQFLGISLRSGGEVSSAYQMYPLSVFIVPSWIVVLAKTLLMIPEDAFQIQEVLEFLMRQIDA